MMMRKTKIKDTSGTEWLGMSPKLSSIFQCCHHTFEIGIAGGTLHSSPKRSFPEPGDILIYI